jgi:diacylglycerol kinase family enzyme
LSCIQVTASASWPRRSRARCRPARHGWRRRLAGARRVGREPALHPVCGHPAGTRNHFALDLGLDRADVSSALDAYQDGVDTKVDLAEVNRRVFVNNASMGVYAKIVQSADYRDAKMQTAAAMLPDLLGPEAQPLDLRLTLPSGQEAAAGQLLLVSNNPYQLAQLRGGGTRVRLDGGVLGVVTVRVDTWADAEKLAALELAGNTRRFASWNEWTASELEVRSARPVEIGIDGEALTLQPPLRFVIRPGALTVRLARTAPRGSPAARAVRVIAKPTLQALWQTALGRPAGLE